MAFTPSQLSTAEFRTVRKGYDPDAVDSLLRDAAVALEQAQQQATAMEARARAAVARLQESSDEEASSTDAAARAVPASEPVDDVRVGPDEAETISRTLVLAQRTADTAIAQAEADAERIRGDARAEADAALESSRETSAQMVDDARAEARQVSENERVAAANEVESLKARREFLLGDVDQLEAFLVDQRDRLRGAARQIEALCERVPSGLGTASAPIVSASDDEPGDDTSEFFMAPESRLPFADSDGHTDADPVDDDRESLRIGKLDIDTGQLDTGELDATQPVSAVGDVDHEHEGSGENAASI